MKEKQTTGDILKQAEKARIEAEMLKFQAERKKIDLEISHIQDNAKKPWYRKERTIQAFVAGIVSFPVLWFFFSEIIEPSYQKENIELALDNAKTKAALEEQKETVREKEAEFNAMQAKAETDMKNAWDEVDAVKKENAELLAKYEDLLADYKSIQSGAVATKRTKALSEIEQNLVSLKSKSRRAKSYVYKPSSSLAIENQRLVGEAVEFQPSPNTSGPFKTGYPDAIVFHFSSTQSLEATVKPLTDPKRKASAHVVIDRGGKIVQLLPFDEVAWHTGRSSYKGRSGYNNYSIGIELVNAGRLKLEGRQYRAWFGKTYDESEAESVVLPNSKSPSYWQKFTKIQLERVDEIVALLSKQFKIKEILGHNEISQGRKLDPGPLFPTKALREKYLPGT